MVNSPMLSTPSLRPYSATGTFAPVTQRPSRPASQCILRPFTTGFKVSSRYLFVVARAKKLGGEWFQNMIHRRGAEDAEITQRISNQATLLPKTPLRNIFRN